MSEKTEPLGPRVGDVIGAKYRIVRRIGTGGMGEVYEAHHLQLNERVALKTLLGTLEAGGEHRVRFLREAQATAKIRNEHVVSVFDVGELQSGAPYIVMEYLEGHDLAELASGPHRPVQEIVDYLLQACEALAIAHVRGIVHRDLKPSNLFLTTRADGSICIKVLDFGISKGAENDDGLTGTNEALGTVRYMSPEQLRSSRDVDARTDIWSLGVVLFELLTHELPFRTEHGGSLALKIIDTPPRALAELRTGLPQGLVAITLRCLEKDRAQRFESISELAIALAPFGTNDAMGSCERILRIAGPPSRPSLPFLPAQPALSAKPPQPNTGAGWGVSGPRGAEARYGLIALIALIAVLGGAILTLAIVLGVRARAGHPTAATAIPYAPSTSPSTATSITADAAPSGSASAASTLTAPSSGVPSSAPTPGVPAVPGSSLHPPRPTPKVRPANTVSDDRHG